VSNRPAPHARRRTRLTVPASIVSMSIDDRVLYRDGLMLIVDKPAGLPVHGGPGGGPNLEMLLPALRFGLPAPPALAHRLDRDTSGCLILGRHRKALARLGRLFADGRIEKVYWAVATGEPAVAEGLIEAPLFKQLRGTGWRMIIDAAGRPAVSSYRVLATGGGMSLIEVRPRTGRTHQVRVHLASIGCPVSGDPVYGRAGNGEAAGAASMQLHARSITVPLYPHRPPITAIAPLPAPMRRAITALGLPAPDEDPR
jgi:tRNA pseudouridine32 synthase/23S rRNA pseudouridine746 synthase